MITIGVLAEFILLLFFDKEMAVYGPIIFWAIGGIIMLNYGVNIFKLSSSIKNTKPQLYKRHSFGLMINTSAFYNKEFLSALNDQEQNIIKTNKKIFLYLPLCFGLFMISIIILQIR